MITISAVYTAQALVKTLTDIFKKELPECRLINIVDDPLIKDVIKEGKVTKNIINRMLYHYQASVAAGADYILNTCSSVSEVVDLANQFIEIPILKIDEPMIIKAIELGQRIGVLATLSTTLNPTVNLVYKKAQEINKKVEVIKGLAEGGYQALVEGKPEQHDKLIMETAKKISTKVDVIVLAQGSMARIESLLEKTTGTKILSSPKSAVLNLKKLLK